MEEASRVSGMGQGGGGGPMGGYGGGGGGYGGGGGGYGGGGFGGKSFSTFPCCNYCLLELLSHYVLASFCDGALLAY